MPSVLQLEQLRQTHPTFCWMGESIGQEAAKDLEVSTAGVQALALPPEIVVELILLTLGLFKTVIECLKDEEEPTPEELQKFLTERPRFSFRGRWIRRTANSRWKLDVLKGPAVGWAVDERCQSLTGGQGLSRIISALEEVKMDDPLNPVPNPPVEGLRSCSPFRVQVADGAAAIERVKRAIETEGGTLAGGPTSGSFSGAGIVGTYQEEAGKPGSYLVTITHKPLIYPCSTIESKVREFFN